MVGEWHVAATNSFWISSIYHASVYHGNKNINISIRDCQPKNGVKTTCLTARQPRILRFIPIFYKYRPAGVFEIASLDQYNMSLEIFGYMGVVPSTFIYTDVVVVHSDLLIVNSAGKSYDSWWLKRCWTGDLMAESTQSHTFTPFNWPIISPFYYSTTMIPAK